MKPLMKEIAKLTACAILAIAFFSLLGATWKQDQYINRENTFCDVISYSSGVASTLAFPAPVKHVEVRFITTGSTGKFNFDFKTTTQDPTMDGVDENYVDASYLIEHVDINASDINYYGNGGSGTVLIYATW